MNKMLATIISIALALVFAILAVTIDAGIDRKRLQEVATMPNYTPPTVDYQAPTEDDEKEGDDAPEFTVTDANGNTISLHQLRGKPVILHFWASWVASSARELSMLQQAYIDYEDQVHFVIVNTVSDNRETQAAAEKLLATGNFTFTPYYDLDASAANSYSVIQLPTTFFIDANGKAIAYAASEIDRSSLDLGVQYCIANAIKATAPSETTETTETTEPTGSTTAA